MQLTVAISSELPGQTPNCRSTCQGAMGNQLKGKKKSKETQQTRNRNTRNRTTATATRTEEA